MKLLTISLLLVSLTGCTSTRSTDVQHAEYQFCMNMKQSIIKYDYDDAVKFYQSDALLKAWSISNKGPAYGVRKWPDEVLAELPPYMSFEEFSKPRLTHASQRCLSDVNQTIIVPGIPIIMTMPLGGELPPYQGYSGYNYRY